MHVCVLGHGQHFGLQGLLPCQAPLAVEFSRQEYWSWLPFPYPGDLPDTHTIYRQAASQEKCILDFSLFCLNVGWAMCLDIFSGGRNIKKVLYFKYLGTV